MRQGGWQLSMMLRRLTCGLRLPCNETLRAREAEVLCESVTVTVRRSLPAVPPLCTYVAWPGRVVSAVTVPDSALYR